MHPEDDQLVDEEELEIDEEPVLAIGTDPAPSDTGEGDHPRYEDSIEAQDDTPTESVEIDPEESRKDDSTVLATDRFDSEGNRVLR